jgi:hypothetical protein
MKLWTELLLPSQVAYMNSIIEQVPTEHGARDAFVNCLQGLADKAEPPQPKFRYLVTDITSGEVFGTNDVVQAEAYVGSEDNFVVDVVENQWIQVDLDRVEITEAPWIEISDDYADEDGSEEVK